MSSSVSATNSPSFSSNDPGQIARRIAFSSMHSIADSRSFTAYRAPECNSPWWRPVVPEVNSPRSTKVIRIPRNVRSWASAPPVPPPPTIRTCGTSRDARGADRVIEASLAPRGSRDVLVLLLFGLSFGERAFLVLVLLGLLTFGEVAVFSVPRVVVFLLLAFRVRARLALVGLLLLTLGEVAVVVLLLRHAALLGRVRRNGGHFVRIRHSTQSNVRVTAFFQSAYSLSRSAASIRGCHSLSLPQLARRSSTSFQNPTASPAAYAAPSEVVSATVGRMTGTSRTSAWNCISVSL